MKKMDLITFKNILKFEMSSFLEKNTQIKVGVPI